MQQRPVALTPSPPNPKHKLPKPSPVSRLAAAFDQAQLRMQDSRAAIIRVAPMQPPLLTQQPQDMEVVLGNDAQFAVTATVR